MTQESDSQYITLAVPKGRILEELLPCLEAKGIKMSDEFFTDSRKLFFDTNLDYVKVIKCRSYDAATFASCGGADIAICGSEVLDEFDYPNIYNIFDLEIGKCRLSVAGVNKSAKIFDDKNIVVATKYPNLTSKFFAGNGVKAEIIKLNGAIELAAKLNLCDYIIDLVSSGQTLKENDLYELQEICDISSRVIVNKASFASKNQLIKDFCSFFYE